jgi:sugar fermentation stimulation protein A
LDRTCPATVESVSTPRYQVFMRFIDPLISGRLLRRYKRFLSDIELPDGEQVVAHCPNPGSMMGLAEPGRAVWLSPSRNPARKLAFTWELVDAGTSLVGINTGWANAVVAEAWDQDRIPELAGYRAMRREVRYGERSRIDLLLEAPGRSPCYVEIKSVTLRRDDARAATPRAEFPDAVTARGARHLGELARVVEAGGRAALFYLVQRGDCRRVTIASDIDPGYARAFEHARARGVEVFCYDCRIGPEAIELGRPLPVDG